MGKIATGRYTVKNSSKITIAGSTHLDFVLGYVADGIIEGNTG